MGESVIGRPIGPSYVPGTSQGNSSANAPSFLQPAQTQMATSTAPATTPPATNPSVPNPAQDPRQKWWNQANAMIGKNPNIKVAGQSQPPSSIGASQITGVRRFSG